MSITLDIEQEFKKLKSETQAKKTNIFLVITALTIRASEKY
ncbi:hypothetical protein [Arcobacter sp. CECT 8989]|nr:hypothetical protein [Arcobacter sp. CECT 8989]